MSHSKLGQFFNRFDPERLFFRQAIRTSLVATLALAFTDLLHFRFNNDLFAIWGAIFIIQVNTALTVRQQLVTILITGLICGATVWVGSLLQELPYLAALFVAALAFTTPILGARGFDLWNLAFRICLFGLLGAGIAIPEGSSPFFRFIQVMVGTALAAAVSFLIWPNRPRLLFRQSLAATLLAASNLYRAMVDRIGTSEEGTVGHKAIRNFHQSRDRAVRLLHRNGQIADAWIESRSTSQIERELTHKIEGEIDQLYEILLSLGTLRTHDTAPEKMEQLLPELSKIGEGMELTLDHQSGLAEMVSGSAGVVEFSKQWERELSTKQREELQFLIHYLLSLIRSCQKISFLNQQLEGGL